MPCCNHSHRETRKSVWMCAESTATAIVRGGHRGTVRHASAHTEQRTQPAVQKQRGEKNDPKSRQHLHAWRASCSRVTISAGDASQRPYLRQEHSCRAVCNYLCVCDEGAKKNRSAGRHINTARGTAGWQQYMQYDPKLNNHARWQHTHPQKQKQKTRRQSVWLCVWRCGCLPALATKKQNKRERNVCSAPQALVARPHVTAPSARRSSRPLLMRAAGEAHRAVVMSVSVGVRVEQLGGKHTAPSQEECRRNNYKSRKEKRNSTVIAPKAKKRRDGGVKDF
ncbi:hypothetical protein TCDM_11748 [Trypanosoma cruzi Dm28c]|uniref:Uncharacterized protein n=1 Tax=Trypanosoma cruzi Dm28c TaxID=1416333 RepID=V5B8M3_TRYCR|nr:hypothetical protein TCDM_11748 [Trypanosoma cruzi Dm28c]